MKKIKIISVFIILLTIFSLCSLTVNAEETPDASKLVVVVDEDYRYYDLGGMTSVTWTTYLNNYYNPTHEDSPFAILGDYVIYENSYLTCRGSLVSATDTVTNSTGVGYYLGDSVYTVTEDTITFSRNIPETMLFSELIAVLNDTDTDNLLTSGGYYGTYYVYYNSRLLSVNDSSISITHNVGSGVVYSLSEVCTHDWYLETVIQANTCVSDGSGEFRCRRCDATEVQTIAADPEDAHLWKLTSSTESTCISPGVKIHTCEYCSKTYERILPALGHKFTEATCTEPSVCLHCGAVGKTLDHDYNLLGKCKNCGEKAGAFNDFVSDQKQNIEQGWNKFTGAIGDGWNWIVSGGKTIGNTIIEVVTPGEDDKILGIKIPEIDINGITDAVSYGINIILALVGAAVLFIVIYYVSKMVANFSQAKNLAPKKRKRKRRRRRKK